MATYQSIRELTRGLQQGAKLLNDMFVKRKTVAIRYDDALATLDGDENKLRHLIHFGVIVATGDTLELGEVYQRFFEEVLAVNEDINVATTRRVLSSDNRSLHDSISGFLPLWLLVQLRQRRCLAIGSLAA
ncbi:MAG: hypothetical protein IJT30_01745 [Muribaculaceae bacterium]|nr:hypothetical protein [Muribaculaceae bacterium]